MSDEDDTRPSPGAIRKPAMRRSGCGFRYEPGELSGGVDFSRAHELLNGASEPLLRDATPDDAEAIAERVNSAYRGDISRRGWTTEADLLGGQRTDAPMIRELLAESLFRLAWDGDILIGNQQIKHLNEKTAELGMLAVAPDRQGEGIGRHLVTDAEAIARERLGCGTLKIHVLHQRAELLHWYESLGFERTGETAPFPTSQRFGKPRVKDLWFVTLKKSLLIKSSTP
ncbi:GNAT family N-acetyltransferase [Halovibrio salipaludis]|uniref:GNAT family N-acetyltransferase n=1 Tax=Halovibrio salipaludis TaxID=2032626 RepID=A0A2A2F5L2_9GAMM|nr:GNAT family N-acetyltransferase [Halovibrio salipaludis]PAU79833.1 GNAT family N-acetyltransferase [Halovibrio salipaludis]